MTISRLFPLLETEVDYKVYLELYTRVSNKIKELLIEGHEVNITPIGKLVIIGHEPSRKPIDFNAMMKLWEECPECKERRQKVYYLNPHTDGFVYGVKWRKRYIRRAGKVWYRFVTAKSMKDDIYVAIKNGQEYYDTIR